MKYNEFMHINEDFIPVFDLENEEADQYWSLFIPNDKFRDILSSAIDSLNPTNQKNPIWLQGTYGTGKTHATSVIKHLLCDEKSRDTGKIIQLFCLWAVPCGSAAVSGRYSVPGGRERRTSIKSNRTWGQKRLGG